MSNNISKYPFGRRLANTLAALVILIAVLFVSTYLCYHSVAVFDDLYMTGVVGRTSVGVFAELDAAFFRDDEIITLDGAGNGNIRYMLGNGEKIGYDRESVRVYTETAMTEDENATLILRMREIESELEHIDELLDLRHTTYYSAASQVQSSYTAFIAALGTKDPQNAVLASEGLASSLNRFDAVKNGRTELEGIKETLKTEYESLENRYFGSYCSVLTEKSGYFFDRSEIDGYEGVFSTNALKSINADSLRALMSSEPAEVSEDAVGKMTYSYSWYIAAVAEDTLCRELEIGAQYNISFTDSGETLVFTLERIASVINGEGVLIFKCDTMPRELELPRVSRIQLETGSIEGLSVPSSAICNENGVTCIYTLKRGKLIRKRADVLYESNGMCIVSEKPSDLDDTEYDGLPYPEFNDVMIISGSELYDGKVLG